MSHGNSFLGKESVDTFTQILKKDVEDRICFPIIWIIYFSEISDVSPAQSPRMCTLICELGCYHSSFQRIVMLLYAPTVFETHK